MTYGKRIAHQGRHRGEGRAARRLKFPGPDGTAERYERHRSPSSPAAVLLARLAGGTRRGRIPTVPLHHHQEATA